MAESKPPTPASYADFSENPEPGGWLRTLVQFFAIPLLIVCIAVGLYVGVTLMIGTGPTTTADFVELLQSDTVNRRWQAAMELARRLQTDEVPAEFRDPKLVEALTRALDRAREHPGKPPRMATTILSILHRLEDPASLPALRAALDDPHPWIRSHAIRALVPFRDRASRDKLLALAGHEDFPTRQAALYALAELDQVEGLDYRLSREIRDLAVEHLGDREEDVRFTAALILARAGERREALPVLKTMLDRAYLERFELDGSLTGINRYRLHSNVILKALSAVERLDARSDPEVVTRLRTLADDDTEGDPDVRSRATTLLRNWDTN